MAHVFDLASNWTADTNVMILQGWYGIPEDEGGSEDDFGVWDIAASAGWYGSNPSAYPYHPYGIQDATISSGGQRFIGSFVHPLEGLYSTSGRDAASVAHIDRELAVLRRAGDPRGRIDVLAATCGHILFTSYNPALTEDDPDFAYGLDRRYRHFVKLLERANAAGLTNCITVNYEAYQVWLNYSPDTYADKNARLYAVALDLQGFVSALKNDPAAFKIDGRVVVFFYEGDLKVDGVSQPISAAEWNIVFEEVRKPFDANATPLIDSSSPAGTNHDFYVIGRNYGAGDVAAMDGLIPWLRADLYNSATGTHREKCAEWAEKGVTDFIQNAVTNNPTRIAMANFSMGYETWVKGWGAGSSLFIERNLDTIAGQFDGYAAIESGWQRPGGICVVTWDDYPEATSLEPTFQDKGEFLGAFTEAVAAWEGDTPDPDDTAALRAIWENAAGVSTVTSPIQYTQGGRQMRKGRRAIQDQGA